MAGALIIVFREVIEAGLILGIVLAATQGVRGSRAWIAGGVAAGVLGSFIVALFTGTIAQAFEGFGQELFNAAVLATAVVMLTWHNVWMASHGRQMAADLNATGRDVVEGRRPLMALAIVVGAAVLREGSEVVLFLYGIAAAQGGSASGLIAGGLIGLFLGATVSALTYFGLLRIPARYLFGVTTWLITLLSAGMAAQAVRYLEQAGVVEVFGATAWDSSALLSEGSIPGLVLATLIGYAERPTVLQVVVYIAVIVLTYVATKWVRAAAARSRHVKLISAE
ncbi:MAG TPA: FTR1 family protein [Aestuariivirga sp.]|nr:FTR1 family protein [Aestuariivirga sp.]